jgi:hypothetical protein
MSERSYYKILIGESDENNKNMDSRLQDSNMEH